MNYMRLQKVKEAISYFLAISNIRKYCRNVKIIGLSATVNDPSLIAGWLAPEYDCDIILCGLQG